MAEAHQAVGLINSSYDPLLSSPLDNKLVYDDEDFLVIRINREALEGIVRRVKSSFRSFALEVKNSIYPNSYINWFFSLLMPPAVMLSSTPKLHGTRSFLWNLTCLPVVKASSKNFKIGMVSAVAGSVIFITACFLRRLSLRALLSYKSWLYEAPRKQSLATKLWYIGVRLLTGSSPSLFSVQGSLPRLHVPSLKDTVDKYIESVEPIYTEEKMKEVRELAKKFLNEEGSKFQRYLFLKSIISENYISDWWEKYVYLRGRDSIMINSNYYVLDVLSKSTTVQCARAGNLVFRMLEMKEFIENETLEPMLIRNTVPMCMEQYRRMFGTCRIVGHECDTIEHYSANESKYIVTYCNGSYFKVNCYTKHGRLLLPFELQRQFEFVLKKASTLNPSDSEAHVAALTGIKRDKWAEAKDLLFAGEANKASLETIQKAAFILILSDESPETMTEIAYSGMHGKGYDRWFDKSFNLCIYKNGRMSMNCEHSWADAPVIAHLFEYAVTGDLKFSSYDSKGNSIVPPNHKHCHLSRPTLLQFSLHSERAKNIISNAVIENQKASNDLHLKVLRFNKFGKGFVKKCKVSPDAFVQISFQIAFYRTLGITPLTYESSMTRLFRHGRTETVRPASNEVREFVINFCQKKMDKSKLKELFLKATTKHQQLYRDAMCGYGIDRHLFGLYVISQGAGIESPFLNQALSEPWRLSTSQQPQNQTNLYNPKVEKDLLGPGGGFGPVAKNGYGISYMVAGEDDIFFHISSSKSCPETDSDQFAKAISDALISLQEFFLS